MRTAPILLLCLAFSACGGVEMLAATGGGERYGPVESGPKGGVLRYLIAGSDAQRKDRREKAYKMMHDHCGGKYKIASEGIQQKGSETMIQPTGRTMVAVTDSTDYWVIKFECVP